MKKAIIAACAAVLFAQTDDPHVVAGSGKRNRLPVEEPAVPDGMRSCRQADPQRLPGLAQDVGCSGWPGAGCAPGSAGFTGGLSWPSERRHSRAVLVWMSAVSLGSSAYPPDVTGATGIPRL